MEPEPLARFNELSLRTARQEMLACCSSRSWADQMTAGRPYSSPSEAIAKSAAIVTALKDSDLAEALAGHPRIGDRQASGQSRREQSGVLAADADLQRALATASVEYEQRFGHIYLVCASGRTAEELLAMLRARLANDDLAEWQVVRSELQKINEIRLSNFLGESP